MLKTSLLDEPAVLAHPMTRKRVVIIGGGFGGMTAARFLRDVDVILIDRTVTQRYRLAPAHIVSFATQRADPHG